jgi:hypothetical protein
MQHETSPAREGGASRAREAILGLLLVPDDQRPWSIAELEIGDEIATADAVAQLRGEGLLHRLGDFVFASLAAVNMGRLDV